MKMTLVAITLLIASLSSPARAQNLVKPVDGHWLALQGPHCPMMGNHHCNTASQRYAYDFVPLNNYGVPTPPLCLGQPIKSPSNGTVVAAVDTYPNMPHPTQHPAGNHIVIERSPTEYILIAHLSPGSLAVPLGATVTAGQVIGACGHNGNSSAPHIHIHMQSGPNILNFFTPGLPMPFSNAGMMMPPSGCVPVPAGNVLTRGQVLC